jgi:hypothetical protein
VVVLRVVVGFLGAQEELAAEKVFRQVEASQWSLEVPHCVYVRFLVNCLEGGGEDVPIRTASSSCCPCTARFHTEDRSAQGRRQQGQPKPEKEERQQRTSL